MFISLVLFSDLMLNKYVRILVFNRYVNSGDIVILTLCFYHYDDLGLYSAAS